MKHLFICLAAGFLIVWGLSVFSREEGGTGQTLSLLAAPPASGTVSGQEPPRPEAIRVGLLVSQTSSMEEIHFRRVLEQAQGEEMAFHACETGTRAEAQWEMFQKMLEEGHGIIFVKLVDAAEAERYADAALERGVYLVFLQNEPPARILEKGKNLYFLGFSDADSLREAAEGVSGLWNSNQAALDHFQDDVLAFSFLSNESFEESGKAAQFASYLDGNGVEGTLAKDSVTSMFSFDIHKEIDRIWVADTELLICTNSNDARKSLDYLNDPTEFQLNYIRMVLLTADDVAQKMAEDGEILLAIGADGGDLGEAALKMIQAFREGTPPVLEAGEPALSGQRRFYVGNRIVVSPQMTAWMDGAKADNGEEGASAG